MMQRHILVGAAVTCLALMPGVTSAADASTQSTTTAGAQPAATPAGTQPVPSKH